jgi:hypothetical protein
MMRPGAAVPGLTLGDLFGRQERRTPKPSGDRRRALMRMLAKTSALGVEPSGLQ